MLFGAILGAIGIGLVKAPQATIHGLQNIANHAVSWIVQMWQYLGGL